MQKSNLATTTEHRGPSLRGKEHVAGSEIVKTVKESVPSSKLTRPEDITVAVEFKLVADGAKSVAVAGTFNDWNAGKTPLQKTGRCWTTTIELPRGRYEYRFVVDGKWESDPNARETATNPFGTENSVLSI